ncbi:hypothetical protein tonnikala_24 [Escherichia phage tonnikala]|uniref:Uncharacterized protein n=1 Tax=Escherichia phage tonnikala TaxID=2696452 RepID=A0A6B9X433_9CAUD|nr:hypothetical protein H1N81_gp24 [Escherichia phage tonnikala]QHR71295.1 hypothetical protein tonnikala_24 [Escherichia phage tonnikala]
MSVVANQKAIDQTNDKRFAIFITRNHKRYAVKAIHGGYATYMELSGGWYRCENLSNFLVWNAEFQGFDDISSITY